MACARKSHLQMLILTLWPSVSLQLNPLDLQFPMQENLQANVSSPADTVVCNSAGTVS